MFLPVPHLSYVTFFCFSYLSRLFSASRLLCRANFFFSICPSLLYLCYLSFPSSPVNVNGWLPVSCLFCGVVFFCLRFFSYYPSGLSFLLFVSYLLHLLPAFYLFHGFITLILIPLFLTLLPIVLSLPLSYEFILLPVLFLFRWLITFSPVLPIPCTTCPCITIMCKAPTWHRWGGGPADGDKLAGEGRCVASGSREALRGVH